MGWTLLLLVWFWSPVVVACVVVLWCGYCCLRCCLFAVLLLLWFVFALLVDFGVNGLVYIWFLVFWVVLYLYL